MRKYAQQGEHNWEAIDQRQEGLYADDSVYQTCEQPLRDNSMLLNQFREVVESRSYSQKSAIMF